MVILGFNYQFNQIVFLELYKLFSGHLQNHVEGYHELSSKTQIYFSTAVAKWDADFFIKVDDDVHVNLG